MDGSKKYLYTAKLKRLVKFMSENKKCPGTGTPAGGGAGVLAGDRETFEKWRGDYCRVHVPVQPYYCLLYDNDI